MLNELRTAAEREEANMSVMINDEHHCTIWKAVVAELNRSKKLHPNYTTDTVRRSTIVVEEGLEAMTIMSTRLEGIVKAALGSTRDQAGDTNKEATTDDLKKELVQTAAMCFKMLEAMHIEEVV